MIVRANRLETLAEYRERKFAEAVRREAPAMRRAFWEGKRND